MLAPPAAPALECRGAGAGRKAAADSAGRAEPAPDDQRPAGTCRQNPRRMCRPLSPAAAPADAPAPAAAEPALPPLNAAVKAALERAPTASQGTRFRRAPARARGRSQLFTRRATSRRCGRIEGAPILRSPRRCSASKRAGEDGLDLKGPPVGFVADGAPDEVAGADVALSDAVVAYGREASGSRVDPRAISPLIGARPDARRTRHYSGDRLGRRRGRRRGAAEFQPAAEGLSGPARKADRSAWRTRAGRKRSGNSGGTSP